MEKKRCVVSPCNYCVPGGIRTHDLRIRNPALYPAELRGLVNDYSKLQLTISKLS